MKNATELLGARIRELRKTQRLTQDQLAEALGVEQNQISLIEHGKSYPSLDRLMRIAETLKVPLPSLFEFNHLTGEGERVAQLEEMLRGLGEKDQQKIFKIVKVFLEG